MNIDTSSMFSQIAQVGPLFAFMMLVILALCFVVRTLYSRNIDLGDNLQKIVVDSTVASQNNTAALQLLTVKVEAGNAK